MAGANQEIQYYRINPSYDIETRGSGLNLVLKEIVNCKPGMHPTSMSGLWEYLESNVREQTLAFGLEKRDGFKQIFDDEANPTTGGQYKTTDIQEIDGMFYALKRGTTGNGYVHKFFNRHADGCRRRSHKGRSISNNNLDLGKRIGPYFLMSDCSPLNMIKVHGPRDFKAVAVNIRIGIDANGIGYAIINNYTSMNINAYDNIMIYNSTPSIPSQYRIITGSTGPTFTVDFPRAGLNVGDEIQAQAKIFETLGECLMFAGNDGLYHISPDTTGYNDEVTLLMSTLNISLNKPITALANFHGYIVFEKGGFIFIGDGGNNFGGFGDSIETSGRYDDFIKVGQYLVCIGPSRTAVLYFRGVNNIGKGIPRLYEKGNLWGYWNRGSYLRESFAFDSRLVLFDNYGALASYNIVPIDDGNDVSFLFERADIGLRFIGSHLNMLQRQGSESVHITENDLGLQVFINYGSLEQGIHTKLLLFDRQQSFWHTWYLDSISIIGEYYGFRYGNKIYVNEGDNDDGKTINQIISFSFGDITSYDTKKVQSLNMLVGYKTVISNKNFFIKHNYITGEGYQGRSYYTGDHISSEYLKELNAWKNKIDGPLFEKKPLLKPLQMDRGLYGDNLISQIKPLALTTHNEKNIYTGMAAREELIRSMNCFTKIPFEPVENDCGDIIYKPCDIKKEYEEIQMKEDRNEKKYISHDYLQIAKYGQFHIPLGDHFVRESTFTVFAGEKQNIQFLGTTIGFMQTDSDLRKRTQQFYSQG